MFYSFIILSNSWHLPRQEGIILGHQTVIMSINLGEVGNFDTSRSQEYSH